MSISRQRLAVNHYKHFLCQLSLPLFATLGLQVRRQNLSVTLVLDAKSPPEAGFLLDAALAARVYFSSANTLWGCWLAWANMAVAACWMICARDRSEEAVAYSVSMMLLREAARLAETLLRLSAV